MAEEHILGLKNKRLAFGYLIPTNADYRGSLKSRKRVKAELAKAFEDLKKYDLADGEKEQKAMIADGHKFGIRFSKALFNTLMMAKEELELCERIGEDILKEEDLFKKHHGDMEYHKLKQLAKDILAKQAHELGTLRKLLSDIFGLEEEAMGKFNAKMLFKSPPPDVIEKFVTKRRMRDLVREERKIEGVLNILEESLKVFKSGKGKIAEQKKKLFKALKELPGYIEKDTRDLLYIAEHIYVHVKEVIDPFIYIIAANIKAEKEHIIPEKMGEELSDSERKELNEIFRLLKNEQLMMNQLIAKEKETEGLLARVA